MPKVDKGSDFRTIFSPKTIQKLQESYYDVYQMTFGVYIKSSGWPIYSRTLCTTHDTSSHRPKNAKQLQEHGKTNP
ncbi:unnamed protein product [Acanthoscelides obtectus]|uniref:Uncharacterized protein n=1 Tax=Acanthoscelides obtectus TaxID=200917 RepID=A0A9P0PWZ2_ACAOB|nr:unnamed protein product [Acanthoscelides obtectus]CAK1669018.1 hypothetical protein AOBTE_LOCUS26747 [Acanthoscelides obtectus]